MKGLIFLIGVLIAITSCGRKQSMENIILYADREAPLGWIHLTIYKDSTFEYVSQGIGSEKLWKGKAQIEKDSIKFEYYDAIPIVGERAHFNAKYVDFVDLDGTGRIEIKFNKLR